MSVTEICGVYPFRVWREQVWPSSFSQRPSSRCLFLLSGLSSSSLCSSALASQLCLETLREWWFLCRTSECFPELGPKKFSVVILIYFLLNMKDFLMWGLIIPSKDMSLTPFLYFVRSDVLDFFRSWAHICTALWELLASSF